jgi:hypothetical protein
LSSFTVTAWADSTFPSLSVAKNVTMVVPSTPIGTAAVLPASMVRG